MAFIITVTYSDAYGRTTSRRYENTRSTISDAASDAAAMIVLYQAVGDLGVTKFEISQMTPQSVSPQAGANLDVGGTVHAVLDNAKQYAVHIPGIKATMVNPDGALDMADSDLLAWLAVFETGGKFRVSEGNYFTSYRYGELDG
jgi:hypothetical protein